MEVQEAIDILARDFLHYAWQAQGDEAWEAIFPDIGEDDCDAVIHRAFHLLPNDVSTQQRDEAYAKLEERVSDEWS